MNTISISGLDYDDLWEEANSKPLQIDPTDALDILRTFSPQLGTGYSRQIEWENGLSSKTDNYQPRQDLATSNPEHLHPIQMRFVLMENCQSKRSGMITKGQNWFCGSVVSVGEPHEKLAKEPILIVDIHLSPQIYRSTIADEHGEVPSYLSHLFRSAEDLYYCKYNVVTARMQLILKQMLNCPYQAAIKRMYLKSKILELLALMIAQEEKQQKKRDFEIDLVDRV